MTIRYDPTVRKIPITQIEVLNPRERGRKKFVQIAMNIAHLGLKKPVTVALMEGRNGEVRYWLVCGQGRLEAYLFLGQTEIPAIQVWGTMEELHLMSLIENLARRQHSSAWSSRRQPSHSLTPSAARTLEVSRQRTFPGWSTSWNPSAASSS